MSNKTGQPGRPRIHEPETPLAKYLSGLTTAELQEIAQETGKSVYSIVAYKYNRSVPKSIIAYFHKKTGIPIDELLQ